MASQENKTPDPASERRKKIWAGVYSTTDITKMITEFERTGTFSVNPLEKKLIEGISDVQFILAVEYTPPIPRRLRSSAGNTQLAENRK